MSLRARRVLPTKVMTPSSTAMAPARGRFGSMVMTDPFKTTRSGAASAGCASAIAQNMAKAAHRASKRRKALKSFLQ
jgi:hypothetical protein